MLHLLGNRLSAAVEKFKLDIPRRHAPASDRNLAPLSVTVFHIVADFILQSAKLCCRDGIRFSCILSRKQPSMSPGGHCASPAGSFMMPTTSSSISLMLRIYFCRTSAPRFTCTVSGSSLLSRYALMECSFVLPSKNHPTKTSVSCSFRWNRIFSTKNLCVSMVRPLSPLTPRSISLISYSTITIPTFCVKLLPRLYIPFVLC